MYPSKFSKATYIEHNMLNNNQGLLSIFINLSSALIIFSIDQIHLAG